jgi:hypothetical protein
VNRNTTDAATDVRERALDAALIRALPAPRLPAEFRAQLNAALARAQPDPGLGRAELERERLQQLTVLERGYSQLRRRMFGVLGGSVLVAAAAIVLLMPWVSATLGAHATVVLAVFGSIAGLTVGAASWVRHMGVPALIELL